MILKRIYITTIIFSLFFMACNEDFLEKKPIAEESELTFYDSFDALDMTATAAYSALLSQRALDAYYLIGIGSQAEDVEVGGEDISDFPQNEAISVFEHTPVTPFMDHVWGYMYKGIRFTNEFLSRVDDVVERDPDVDSAKVTHRKAEMRFLRAFYHFTLAEMFGGVPIADGVVTPEQFATPRNSIKEVYDFIQGDLKDAYDDLPTRSDVAPEYGRATKGAAQALLAKAYLFESSYAMNYPGDSRFEGCEENWDLALEYAEKVIDSDEYEFIGMDGARFESWRDTIDAVDEDGIGGFRYLFTKDGDNSREGVFEVQTVSDGLGYVEARGLSLVVFTTNRFWYDISPDTIWENDDKKGIIDTIIFDTTHRETGGWSFNLPTDYLANAFGNQDDRYVDLNSGPADPELDPRFQTTIGKDGDLIQVRRGHNLRYVPMATDRDDRQENVPTGMIGRKYECSAPEFWDDMTNEKEGPFNLRLIRYADVILMAAEAAYMENDETKALNYVNMVRERARNSGNTGYPEELTAISMEDIMHERRLELALEGHRFQDVVRWGETQRFIDGHYNTGHGINVNFDPERHLFLPIPYEEIQLSEGALKQYPGWQ